jgi:hypothetical protein
VLGGFRFKAEYETDDYATQRGLEKLIYDAHPSAMKVNGGFNKIRPISPTNSNIEMYLQAAQTFLIKFGF